MTTTRYLVGAMFLCWCTGGYAAPPDEAIPQEFLIATGLTPADSDATDPGRPAVAFDGEKFFLVTCRDADGPAQLAQGIVRDLSQNDEDLAERETEPGPLVQLALPSRGVLDRELEILSEEGLLAEFVDVVDAMA